MQAVENIELGDIRALRPLPSELRYGATIDCYGREQVITEFMIRRACQEVESMQQFPYCSAKNLRAVKV